MVLGGDEHVEDTRCRIDIEAGAQIPADLGGGDVWHGGGGSRVWEMDGDDEYRTAVNVKNTPSPPLPLSPFPHSVFSYK